MGERVTFPSNGHHTTGYFAAPAGGHGPGIVVIQEWWGLVPHIEDIADRFAKEGFCAIAPDLYHGKTTQSPDEAGKMLMELDVPRAEREIRAAGDYLLARPECTSKTFGVVGFCMGGALAQHEATMNPDKVGAVVSFYGGFKKVATPWENLQAPIILIYGEEDQGVPVQHGRELEQKLLELGKKVELVAYPGANHAFFNDTKPNYKADAASDAWKRTVEFFRSNLA